LRRKNQSLKLQLHDAGTEEKYMSDSLSTNIHDRELLPLTNSNPAIKSGIGMLVAAERFSQMWRFILLYSVIGAQ
jgi:hypothetical protein